MKTKRERIEDKLLALGIKPNLYGFRYLVDAVEIWQESGGVPSITKDIYPEIAAKHGATGSRVERAIRNAIESAYDSCDYEDIATLLGTKANMNKGELTNGEFIATLALKVAREERRDRK